MFHIMYKITNTVNGMIYVGVHKTTDIKDNYMGSGRLLKKARKKYGPNVFKKEILAIFENADEMWEIESLIVDEEFVKRKDTYNIRMGGRLGAPDIRDTEYHKSGYHLENMHKARLKSLKRCKELKSKRIEEYEANPKLCFCCNKALEYKKRTNKFCSSSCAAKINNAKRIITEEHRKKVSESIKKVRKKY